MRILREGIALGYDEAGQGEPTVVLVHGWATDRSLWRPLFAQLKASHRAIAVDLRGFGESAAPEQPYTIEGYADDLAFMMDKLDIPKAIVVGHSMGGMIALDFASRHPGRAAAAILLEGMVVAPPPLLAGLRPMLDGVRSERYREVVAGLMGHLTGPWFEPAERARLAALAASCPQHVLVSALEGILAFDSIAAAKAVKCPLLYIGTATSYADLGRFRELCPQLVTGQLVGCGHYFPLEVPDQLSPMIARFIRTSVAPPAAR